MSTSLSPPETFASYLLSLPPQIIPSLYPTPLGPSVAKFVTAHLLTTVESSVAIRMAAMGEGDGIREWEWKGWFRGEESWSLSDSRAENKP